MQTGVYEVAPEMELVLFERAFMKGDLVKQDLTDLESAVVVDVDTECTLEHVISKERLPSKVPWNHLKNAVKIEAKDKVVYDEWIGTVEEVRLRCGWNQLTSHRCLRTDSSRPRTDRVTV